MNTKYLCAPLRENGMTWKLPVIFCCFLANSQLRADFVIQASVQVTASAANVRTEAGGNTITGVNYQGAIGTVVKGPTNAFLSADGQTHTWYLLDFFTNIVAGHQGDTLFDGWVAAELLTQTTPDLPVPVSPVNSSPPVMMPGGVATTLTWQLDPKASFERAWVYDFDAGVVVLDSNVFYPNHSVVMNLPCGKQYIWKLTGRNGNVANYIQGSQTGPLNFKIGILQAPTITYAENDFAGATVTWQDNEGGADAVQIWRKDPGAQYVETTEIPANLKTFTDAGTTAGLGYWYKLKIRKGLCYSDFSAEALAEPAGYRVTISAGNGGTASPSGPQDIPRHQSASFTGSPNVGYDIDTWTTNGVFAQTGGSSFTISDVGGNIDVLVTFKIKTYTLSVSSDFGDVSIEPMLTRYPHGGAVTVSVKAQAAGSVFVQWKGTLQSLENALTFNIIEDTVLTAAFVPVTQAPQMRVANSTPSTFAFSYPTTDGYTYVLYGSTDASFWKPLTAKTGKNGTEVAHEFSTGLAPQCFYRIERFATYWVPPFLSFPLPDGDPATSKISSILDHHGKVPYEKDGAILTYKGELGMVTELCYGYRTKSSTTLESCNNTPGDPNYYKDFFLVGYGQDPSGTDFDLPNGYDAESGTTTSKGLAWYDGHPAYDYPALVNTHILAAADGTLIPGACGQGYNIIAIQHGNGYRTFYYHCNSWSDRISAAVATGTEISITRGEVIGYVGDTGAAPGQYHLHFEVQRYSLETAAYIIADPYGFFAKDGTSIDPPLWL